MTTAPRSAARSTSGPPPRQGRVRSGRSAPASPGGAAGHVRDRRPPALAAAARGCRRRPSTRTSGSRSGRGRPACTPASQQHGRRRSAARDPSLTRDPRSGPASPPCAGSVGPSPYAGHQRATGQAPQAGLRAWQTPAAVPDQVVAEHRPVALGEQRADLVLDLDRVGLLGPAEAAGQPAEVRVHGDARDPERVAEHHVGGLATDAGQRDQVLELAAAPRRRTARRAPATA